MKKQAAMDEKEKAAADKREKERQDLARLRSECTLSALCRTKIGFLRWRFNCLICSTTQTLHDEETNEESPMTRNPKSQT
jgi:hypothetical protein